MLWSDLVKIKVVTEVPDGEQPVGTLALPVAARKALKIPAGRPERPVGRQSGDLTTETGTSSPAKSLPG